MRLSFVHEAVLRLEPGADPRAPGAGVTVALCGHWDHEGPCRWPHLSSVAAHLASDLTLRVLFAAERQDEAEVRSRIAAALRLGRVDGAPQPTTWCVLRDGPAELRPDEVANAEKLTLL